VEVHDEDDKPSSVGEIRRLIREKSQRRFLVSGIHGKKGAMGF
jgi:hypothetical protein